MYNNTKLIYEKNEGIIHPACVAMGSVKDLTDQISNLTDQISILTGQKMSLEKENKALRGFMRDYQEDLDSERAACERYISEKVKLNVANLRLKAEIDRLKAAAEKTVDEKVSILIKKIARLQAENFRKQLEIDDLQEGFEY